MIRIVGAGMLTLALATSAAAGFTSEEWRFRKAIRLESQAAYAEIGLDGETFASSQNALADLRIIAPTGGERPYLLRRWPGSPTETAVATAMLNRSVLPRQYTRFELHIADVQRAHNRLRLSIAEREFRRRVTVEGSDDRRTWYVLSSPVIYRFTEETSVERTTIVYPQSTYRYLRVTIHDGGERPLTIDGAALLFDQTIPPREDRWFSGPVESSSNPQTRTTTATMDLRFKHVPIHRVVLGVTEPAAFARRAEINVSDDGQTWAMAGQGQLFRPPAAAPDAPVEITFEETQGRYVRIIVLNGDSGPVKVTRASVYGIRRTLLFQTAADRSYWLYLGSSAPAPQYDLPQLLGSGPQAIRTAAGSLGPLEPNPAYRPPRQPWTEEHPVLLWSILGVVVLGLAFLIFNTARKVGRAS